jgi:hypothetical protein
MSYQKYSITSGLQDIIRSFGPPLNLGGIEFIGNLDGPTVHHKVIPIGMDGALVLSVNAVVLKHVSVCHDTRHKFNKFSDELRRQASK